MTPDAADRSGPARAWAKSGTASAPSTCVHSVWTNSAEGAAE